MLHIMCRNKSEEKKERDLTRQFDKHLYTHGNTQFFTLDSSVKFLCFTSLQNTDYLLTEKSTNDIDTKLKHNSLHIFIPLSLIVFFFL